MYLLCKVIAQFVKEHKIDVSELPPFLTPKMVPGDIIFQEGQSVKVVCQLLQSEVDGVWSKAGHTSPAPVMIRGRTYEAKVVRHVPLDIDNSVSRSMVVCFDNGVEAPVPVILVKATKVVSPEDVPALPLKHGDTNFAVQADSSTDLGSLLKHLCEHASQHDKRSNGMEVASLVLASLANNGFRSVANKAITDTAFDDHALKRLLLATEKTTPTPGTSVATSATAPGSMQVVLKSSSASRGLPSSLASVQIIVKGASAANPEQTVSGPSPRKKFKCSPLSAPLYGVGDIVEVLENGNWCASQVLEIADDGSIKVSFYLDAHMYMYRQTEGRQTGRHIHIYPYTYMYMLPITCTYLCRTYMDTSMQFLYLIP
jgi:hypothetical protein